MADSWIMELEAALGEAVSAVYAEEEESVQ